ncbi:MAG: hypothetical protein Q4E87_09570 [bacterium]|nr:hypothetical protein [bacterium]
MLEIGGAFSYVYKRVDSSVVGGGTSYNSGTMYFDANNGATVKGIYGNSSTVQPPAYKVYAWKRTA